MAVMAHLPPLGMGRTVVAQWLWEKNELCVIITKRGNANLATGAGSSMLSVYVCVYLMKGTYFKGGKKGT